MKKVKRSPLIEASPSTSSYQVGDGDRARFRYQSLWLDYLDLQKETDAKKKQLMKAKQRKLKVEAEVKFLRRKLKSLSNNPAQIIQHRLKKLQTLKEETSSNEDANQVKKRSGIVIRDRDAAPRASVIDLNQACVPIGDEMDDFNGTREPVRPDKAKSYHVEGEQAIASDVRTSVCRDDKGKRKITWQDHLALRV
ncbi:ribosomal RNA small subunit methyltransferase G [Rhynchospora pubera]|uniref:Ribosomal RNA small subunit methyltransferase G n=1 Tax=Rhynchospora pubera TaxID=906938 RepID=A0AAV8CKI7_9POAL|nr:ribosomal RNA small subunit methyltransferase G [Rhynchospora pubera]